MAKILVVDDSPTEMFRFREVLQRHGHQVIEANNGADGVALAASQRPDLVLMDVVMPGMNGFQATRQIARNKEIGHIPVVIVSTKDQPTDRLWGQRQGARDYLTKPVEETTLMGVVNRLLSN